VENARFAALTVFTPDATKTPEKFQEASLAEHPSVIKRHRQSVKRRARNTETKSKLRTLIKKARQAITVKNPETISAQIRLVNKELSKAVSKGIIKRNTASRWLSRLTRSAARTETAAVKAS
jgi:small subunit ribosomal protein S20